jgi:RNA polymerase sigma-32 factor
VIPAPRGASGDQLILPAPRHGVSRERVRQIEVRAFEKVQKAIKNRVALSETSAPLSVQ